MDSPVEKGNVRAMFDSLAEEMGMEIADVQAVLWYYEKRLYKKIGAESPGSEDIGFDEAAKRIYDSLALFA
jgi:hypothetical protein